MQLAKKEEELQGALARSVAAWDSSGGGSTVGETEARGVGLTRPRTH